MLQAAKMYVRCQHQGFGAWRILNAAEKIRSPCFGTAVRSPTGHGERSGATGTTGARLLAKAARIGPDVLVVAAYARRRARYVVLAGATHHILRAATISVTLVG